MATLNFQVLYPINDTKITLSDFDLNQTVKDLKTEISQKLNCSENYVDLVLLGSVLDEDKSINELDLNPWTLIHIIVRDEDKIKHRTFEPFTEEQMQTIAKRFSRMQHSSFRKLIRPDTVQSILLEYPEFRSDKVALTILKDSILLSSLQHIETLRKFNEKHRVLLAASELISTLIYTEPPTIWPNAQQEASRSQIALDDLSDSSSSSSSDTGGPSTSADSNRRITTEQLAAALALASSSSMNSLANIAQRNLSEPQPSGTSVVATSSGASTSSPLPTRITSSMFSDALSQALNSAQAPPSANVPENTIVTPPADLQQNESRYASELQTMRDMGLLDNQVNLQALMMCNGDVDAAINLLFSGAIA